MEIVAALVLFACIVAVSTFAGVRLWARPHAAIDRVTKDGQDDAALHPSLAFRGLIEKLGSIRTAGERESGRIQGQLLQAGFRRPGAVRLYYGWRVALAVLAPLGLAPLIAGSAEELDRKLLELALAAVAGYAAPGRYLAARTRRRRKKIARGLPDALDLLVVCVESGLGLDQAIMQAAKELETARPEISQEFALMNYDLRGGKRRADALRDMAARTGVEDLRKLATVLIQADKFGTSVAQTLRGQSDFMRLKARQTAEEKAAKLGVKLVFPIFFCILPSLFVVTVGPVFAKVSRELLPMLQNI